MNNFILRAINTNKLPELSKYQPPAIGTLATGGMVSIKNSKFSFIHFLRVEGNTAVGKMFFGTNS
jgi:hypothetical protein